MGWNNSTTVTIPAGADVLSAGLSITGLPDEADPESYPGTPTLCIGGQTLWKFEGGANGLLGRQSDFVLAPSNDRVDVGPRTPAVLNVRLPAAAVVTEAGLTLEGAGVLSPTLDAGADGSPEWSYAGAFSVSQAVAGLAAPMNDFLRNRAVAFPDAWGNLITSVPLIFGAGSNGTLKVTGLRVIYEAALPVAGLGPALDAAAHSGSPGDTVVPLQLFSDHRGRLRVSNISIEHDRLPTTTLLSPANGAVVNTTDVRFRWSSADPDGDPLVFNFNLRGPGGNEPTMILTDTSYTAAGLEPGEYTWSVIPNDGYRNGSCLSGEFTFRVVSPGAVPQVALLEPANGAALAAGPVSLRWTPWSPVSGEVSYRIYLDESNATTLLFELFGAANNSLQASSLPADRLYHWTVVPCLSEGSNTTKGYCSSGIWAFTLGNASAGGPHPPRITYTAPQPGLVGHRFSFQVAAVDDHGDTLSYSLVDFPPGMVVDFSTGLVSWTPGTDQTGTFEFIVSVTDGRTAVRQAFTVTVSAGTPPLPSVRIAYPRDGARANHSLYIMGAVSTAPGAPEVRTVEVKLDAGPWMPANLSGDGWSYYLDTSRSRNGVHRVAVRAYDGTAHSAEASLNLTYDNPHSVLLDYPLGADPEPLPFIVLAVVVLLAGPLAIYLCVKGRERRSGS
jgi:hypothetical protein